MQQRSFEELAKEWGVLSKDFVSLLGDLLSAKVKSALPLIVGGGIYGVSAIVFGLFLLAWLSITGFFELTAGDFTPVQAGLIVSGIAFTLSFLSAVGLRFHLSRHRKDDKESSTELSEAGKELLTLSKDVAKSTLDPKALLADQTGKIVAGSLILGLLVGFASVGSRDD